MQEYIIDKGLRTKEVGIIFSLSFIISVLLKANGVSDFILDKIIEALSLLKIEQVIGNYTRLCERSILVCATKLVL